MTRGSGFTGFGAALNRWVQEKIKDTDEILSEVAAETAKKGEEVTKYNIETRGTARSGKRGRVETGAMRDAVGSDSRKLGDREYRAEFGWLEKGPAYAAYQEPGFNHVNGVTVEGMYALTDAAEEALQEAREDLERKLRGI